MISYIDIYLTHGGKKYNARLYGDKIVSDQENAVWLKKDIIRYRINYLKRKIQLFYAAGDIIVTYNDVIVRWLDPLFKIRLLVTGIFTVVPVAASLLLWGFSMILPAVLFSAATSLISNYFFKIVRLEKDYSYVKLVMLVLMVCVPVMYWYPFSAYIFAGGLFTFLFFAILQNVFPIALNFQKYYFSLAWLVLITFTYFWFVGAFKIWGDYKAYSSAVGLVSKSDDKAEYTYRSMTWEKPVDWQISPYNFYKTLLIRKNLLRQFLPLPIQFKISTPEYSEFGWIAVSDHPPHDVLMQINSYLVMQKNFLMADLLNKSIPLHETLEKNEMILQSFTYYDMIEREISSIHVILISGKDNNAQGTMIFTFRIPESVSLNYYLDLIRSGLKSAHPLPVP